MAAQTKVGIGSSILASFWATNLIYSCTENCLTIALDLGNDLAYAEKAEAVFAMLAIAAYLLFFRSDLAVSGSPSRICLAQQLIPRFLELLTSKF